jgi:CitMHS family citrate-Mg2+:H+ or citrate-Ca2+:H+ symporter
MTLAFGGLLLVATFMTLVMTKRTTAVVGLVLVPIVFALLFGFGGDLPKYIADGITRVAPTGIMLMFAILYFGIMIDAGLFRPLVNRIIGWAGDDPLRVTLGHTLLVTIVSLDGDGTTTLMVTASALLPAYRRLGISPLVFGVLGAGCTTLMNMSPWGGPTARIAAALHVDPMDIFLPMLPTIAVGIACMFGFAWHFGMRERARIAKHGLPDINSDAIAGLALTGQAPDPGALRPQLIWFNTVLTVGLMTCVVLQVAPLLVLFLLGVVIALLVNYPRMADQRTRLLAHSGNVLSVVLMVLAAGAFTGVLEGTGMINAMSEAITTVLPREIAPALGPVTALLSVPGTFFLSNDAFYFGVLPVLSDTAGAYGITPEQIGRAALLGQPMHGLSPLVAAVYLKCVVLNIELADLQRFAFRYILVLTAVIITAALLTGVVPLSATLPR